MYRRNYIYINPESQRKIKDFRILIGGCGLGSVIAECALRLGFENICIIDGDKVELSNLNRQNYTQHDIGKYKTEVLHQRLLAINPSATITSIPKFLTKVNITDYLKQDYQVAINTIDFSSDIPFVFDEICCHNNIPILHPLNLGWGAAVVLITKDSKKLTSLNSKFEDYEVHMVKHIIQKLKEENRIANYLPKVLSEYDLVKDKMISPPQLSVGSWMVASMCTSLIYKLHLQEILKTFPDVFFQTI